MKRILCILGLHDWQYLHKVIHLDKRICLACDKIQLYKYYPERKDYKWTNL